MRASLRLAVLALVAAASLPTAVSARIPPPRVSLDVLLAKADRIVVGRVQPKSVKYVDVNAKGGGRNQTFHELTLLVARSLDGKDVSKQVTVTMGSFPAKEFPPSKAHPQGRFLLTGWGFNGHLEQEEKGLDLGAEQAWFLERFREDRLRDANSAPHGVDHFDSVQRLEEAGLIELFANRANVVKLRQHVNKAYKGKIPLLAVQGLYGSSDPAAGAFVWEYLQQYDAALKKAGDPSKEKFDLQQRIRRRERMREFEPYYAWRTLNSLGRVEVLKWARTALDSPNLRSLETLKRFQDTESVPKLLQFLANAKEHHEREWLISTLGEIGDVRAIPALIELLPSEKDEAVRLALFQLTDVRLSPNGDFAKRWWERNKAKPRWHWLKQGIEQDLFLLHDRAVDWGQDFHARSHLEMATCWRQKPGDGESMVSAWTKWWQANKDLPQERWILGSFKAAGHPLPDLASKEAVDVLVKAYNTEPDHWWMSGPAIDTNHHAWCQRLLTRLTGWEIEDTHYLHFSRPAYYDYQNFGPKWETEWRKSRYGAKIRPIEVGAKQTFAMEDEDRRLLCQDFASWQAKAEFKPPLVRKQFPGILGKSIVATFEVTLTNTSQRELTLHTKPGVHGETGSTEGFGSSLSAVKWECLSHKGDFATVKPGESIRWLEQHSEHTGKESVAWSVFRLYFEERGPAGAAWRGRVVTPWISNPMDNIREE